MNAERLTTDAGQRRAAWKRLADRVLTDKAAGLPLPPQALWAYSQRLTGFVSTRTGSCASPA